MSNPLSLIFIFLVKVYQAIISPWLPNACRYTPTCSEYAIGCFRKFGFFKAFYLTSKRILSCHPWGGHGHDPVP